MNDHCEGEVNRVGGSCAVLESPRDGYPRGGHLDEADGGAALERVEVEHRIERQGLDLACNG